MPCGFIKHSDTGWRELEELLLEYIFASFTAEINKEDALKVSTP